MTIRINVCVTMAKTIYIIMSMNAKLNYTIIILFEVLACVISTVGNVPKAILCCDFCKGECQESP